MPMSLIFWVIMLLLLLSGLWSGRVEGKPFNWPGFGMTLVTWILFALLGWKTFGPMVK